MHRLHGLRTGCRPPSARKTPAKQENDGFASAQMSARWLCTGCRLTHLSKTLANKKSDTVRAGFVLLAPATSQG
jgi:hypothetical protein